MDSPRISQAEWEVMRVLWERSPLNANEVIGALATRSDWHPKTVRTLLARLVAKGALEKVKRHGVYWFTPLVDEASCLAEESRHFLSRFFAGGMKPMLAHFIEHEDLSAEDLQELQRLLDGKRKGGGHV